MMGTWTAIIIISIHTDMNHTDTMTAMYKYLNICIDSTATEALEHR
jgi:hypothetical protein